MKKIFILALLVTGFTTMQATNSSEYNRGNRYGNQYSKPGIPKDALPQSIISYLSKQYPDYEVMISKRKDDGYYYVKIKYNHNARRPYFRNLVFDQSGNPVRG